MNKALYFLTGYDHFFGQTRKPWVSINTQLLIDELTNYGYEVHEYTFQEVANNRVSIENSIVLYTFSQRDNLRHYIKDTIYSLSLTNNILIPSYELLLCHENKGFQEIYKHNKNIGNLNSLYFSSKRELLQHKIDYPVVLKTIEGSNGKGVFLVHNERELFRTIAKFEAQPSILQRIDFLRRRFFRKSKTFKEYPDYSPIKDYYEYRDYIIPETAFILQPFIAGLQCDYRVIILGDKYFVSKRLTRKGDFRASGAKRFTFDFDIPEELLNYAVSIYEVVDNPTLALDIGIKDGRFYLFEFQAQHFGINAILKSPGYYYLKNGKWTMEKHYPVYEKMLADSFHQFIKSKFVE